MKQNALRDIMRPFAAASLAVAALSMAATSCDKSSDMGAQKPSSSITITARIAAPDTKVTYEFTSETALKQSWKVGDRIIGTDSDNNTYTYEVESVASGVATLKQITGGECGTATEAPANGTNMLMVYAPGYNANQFSSGKLTVSIASQGTTAMGANIDGANVPGIMTATGTVTAGALSLTFANQLELLTIESPKFTLDAATAGTVTWFKVKGVPTKATIDATNGFQTVSGSGTVTKACSMAYNAEGQATGKVIVALLPTADAKDLKVYASNKQKCEITSHIATASNLSRCIAQTFMKGGYVGGEGNVSYSPRHKVIFAPGNLYYDGTGWAFEDNQYDYRTYAGKAACINGDKTVVTPADNWGLFGWVGASSTTLTTAPGMYGVSTSTASSHYGSSASDKLMSDWGNLMGEEGEWFTLSSAEWDYILNTRTASTVNGKSNARYAKATVATVPGLIIFPDEFDYAGTGVTITASTVNSTSASFSTNTFNASAWISLEDAGCTFLPAAGRRDGTTVDYVGSLGLYWSSMPLNTSGACRLNFGSSNVDPTDYNYRYYGYSVRLVSEQ